jgi:hypothetical protein
VAPGPLVNPVRNDKLEEHVTMEMKLGTCARNDCYDYVCRTQKMAVLEFVLRLDVYIDVILELDISTSDF